VCAWCSAPATDPANSQSDSLPIGLLLTFLGVCRGGLHAPNPTTARCRQGCSVALPTWQNSRRFVVPIEEPFRPANPNNTYALRSRVDDCQENIRADEAAPVRRRRSPARATDSGVPQRRHLRLLGGHPRHRSLPPTRGATACPPIVALITKPGRVLRDGKRLEPWRGGEDRSLQDARHTSFAAGEERTALLLGGDKPNVGAASTDERTRTADLLITR
jgi:hypothetical protein